MAHVGRVGLDPEVAIIDNKTGLGVSAHEFLNEKKEFTFYRENDKAKTDGRVGSEIERDGAAIEVRSVIRSACRDNIIPYVAEALRQSLSLVNGGLRSSDDVRGVQGTPGGGSGEGDYRISSQAKYVLDEDRLIESDPPEDVMEFGCRPDFDAYTLEEKASACDVGDMRRWTGGHLHAGSLGKAGLKEAAGWAVLYDYLVAAPMVAILGEAFSEGEAERRGLYGQPGSFRFDPSLPKVEFRTLSGRVLLHPTILYWATGAMKMMAMQTSSPMELVAKLNATIPTEVVYETIMAHDVPTASEITRKVFTLLPHYKESKDSLTNPIGGGGGGTYNPFFFEKAAEVFLQANEAGISFKDDLEWNWGLYEDYEPLHHAYWGIQTAMNRALDDLIFPQNKVIENIFPKGALQSEPIYTHPTVGGARKYTTPGAIHWLA